MGTEIYIDYNDTARKCRKGLNIDHLRRVRVLPALDAFFAGSFPLLCRRDRTLGRVPALVTLPVPRTREATPLSPGVVFVSGVAACLIEARVWLRVARRGMSTEGAEGAAAVALAAAAFAALRLRVTRPI